MPLLAELALAAVRVIACLMEARHAEPIRIVAFLFALFLVELPAAGAGGDGHYSSSRGDQISSSHSAADLPSFSMQWSIRQLSVMQGAAQADTAEP